MATKNFNYCAIIFHLHEALVYYQKYIVIAYDKVQQHEHYQYT